MKLLIPILIGLLVVGCGEKTSQTRPEAKKPESSKEKPKSAAKKPDVPKAFSNTLGMKFVPVQGTKVAFCIWETRVKDYAAYAAANAEVDGSWEEAFKGRFKQPDTHPVVMVSWDDAQAFCAWLTKKELAAGKIKIGQRYRLPTDAEWSVAAGLGKEKGNTPKEKDGGVEGIYQWGKEWPPPKGSGNYAGSLNTDNFKYTSPAGSLVANAHGLYDMGGNVLEWCADWYDPALKEHRVLRGSCYLAEVAVDLLSCKRIQGFHDLRIYNNGGFRCVLASE